MSESTHAYWPQVHTDIQTVTVIVNDTVDQLRLDPDTGPCTFELIEITLLTTQAEPTP